MAATAAQIEELRRMVEGTGTTYQSDQLRTYIERYPAIDERGEEPYTWDTSTTPPTQDDNDDWIDTYDLHAAAADVWQEIAAECAADFDFFADGGQHMRRQVWTNAMTMVRHHRARRRIGTHTIHMYPKPDTTAAAINELVNL